MNKIKIIMVLVVILFVGSYFVTDYIYEREGYIATKENKRPVANRPTQGGTVGDYVDDVKNITDVITDIEDAFDNGYLSDMGSFN